MENALANIETVFAAQEIAATAPTTEAYEALLRYKAARAAARSSEYAGGGISGGLANGGPILEPTLLTGLRTGQRRIAGEAGPEYVVPAGAGGGLNLTVNVNGGVYKDDIDRQKLANEIVNVVNNELYNQRLLRGSYGRRD
jgi:hypothetical protein